MNLSMYQALDDETLAALASKGLLRRAQKDLETGQPELQEERGDALLFSMPGENCTVTLPAAGPAKAACTCPADGCCRHILAAALFLRAQAQQAPAEADQEADQEAPAQAEAAPQPDELLQLSEADLIAWATRPLYRQAVDELAFGELEITIETEGKTTRFRFPQYNIVVRWIAGAGLDGIICSCKQRPTCRHAVAAILFYQAQHGKPLPIPEKKTLEAPSPPRSREEVLESVQNTLAEMVALGLGRLSKTTEGRFTTLAVSAHGVKLYALNSTLRSLSDHLAWRLSRDVRASTPQLLSAAARTYVLAFALRHAQGVPPTALVGEARKHYYDIGNLELVGVGAVQWRSRAGYVGLTLYFWDVAGRRWTSWTDARPTIHANTRFDPQRRYQYDEMWNSAPAPTIISRSSFRLNNVQRNRLGQLSGRLDSQALISGPADLTSLHLEGAQFDDWHKLTEHVAAARASGLVKGHPLDTLVVITPAAWGEPVYDQMRQTLVRPVFDTAGRSLPLALPYSADWPFAVDTLQTWNPTQWETWGVLGTAFITSEGLHVAPISLFNRSLLPRPIQSQVLHLTLDPWKEAAAPTPALPAQETPADTAPPEASEEDEDPPEDEPEDDAQDEDMGKNTSAVGQLLRAASHELEQIAERG
ncbi:MAG TPA: SWIM zinc finger family protein, partial [Ktedonobacterales bacterium]|nr:SWIM zinc finger family protein [Ktedonobacterales bacterium]